MKILFNTSDIENYLISDGIDNFVSLKEEEVKEGNLSPETISYYKQKLEALKSYLLQETSYRYLHEIDIDVIKDYMNYKKKCNKTISNQTLNTNLRAIRAFVNYWITERKINDFKISLFPKTSKPKQPYTKEEQEALIKKPSMQQCTFTEYRNWVISCHLMTGANRSKTLRNIKNIDVDLINQKIRLAETKNGEVYYMPITKAYFPILKEYMKIRKGKPDDYLFCSQYGHQLTADGLRTIMYKYHKNRQVTTGIHRYRNTLAYEMLLDRVHPKAIQSALNHKTTAMLDEYAKYYGQELHEEYNQSSPLSKILSKKKENKIIKM